MTTPVVVVVDETNPSLRPKQQQHGPSSSSKTFLIAISVLVFITLISIVNTQNEESESSILVHLQKPKMTNATIGSNNTNHATTAITTTTSTAARPTLTVASVASAGDSKTNSTEGVGSPNTTTTTTASTSPPPSVLPSSSSISSTTLSNHSSSDNSSTSAASSLCPPFIPPTIPNVYFHPRWFMEHGAGKPFLSHLKDQEAIATLLMTFSVVKYYKSSYFSSNDQELRTIMCYPKIRYYHIHKNGGTTMRKQDFLNYPHHFYTHLGSTNRSTLTWKHIPRPKPQNVTSVFMNTDTNGTTTKTKTTRTITTVPMFTFLRDPILRFPSSLGQVVNNRPDLFQSCSDQSTNAVEFVDCVLATMERTGQYINVHLSPQAYELYIGFQGMEDFDEEELGGVYVMDMKTSFTVFAEQVMGVTPDKLQRQQSRQGDLLYGKFVVDKDVSLTFVDRICELYRVDVLLIQETGVTTTLCPLLES